MTKKKKIIIAIIAVVCLTLGIVLGVVLGKGKKSNAITYVNEYTQSEIILDGNNAIWKDYFSEGEATQKGTYCEEAYTSVTGEVFTHAFHWTEYTYNGNTETIDEVVPFRFVGDTIEYLSKEQAPKDDISVYTKK